MLRQWACYTGSPSNALFGGIEVISYQPGFDRFHAVFRMSCLLMALDGCFPIESDKFRILDFYIAFPFRLEKFTFQQRHISLKKVGKAYASAQPYGGIPEDYALFLRMKPVQVLALDTLAIHEMIDPDSYRDGTIMIGAEPLPPKLAARASSFVIDNGALAAVLRTLASEYPLLGADGLKRRSSLMEFKYDAA